MIFATFNSLIDYIDTLDLNLLTERQLYDIGCLHKKLPRAERNWKELADYLGFGRNSMNKLGTGEAFRKFVYRFGLRLDAYNVEQQETIPDELIGTTADSDNYAEMYKEKQQIRDIYSAYRADLRIDARLEALKETITNAAAQLKDLPMLTRPVVRKGESTTEAILLLSDWHIGQYVDNFYNSFDHDIAIERVSQIVSQTIAYCRKMNVETLHVLNLGDLIEGIIHVNGRINQQMDLCNQLMFASELLAQALTRLQQAAPHVTYRSCLDNHSRVIADKSQHIELENLTRITDWWLRERLSSSHIEFCIDNPDPGFGMFELKDGRNVVFFHGHEGKKKSIMQDVIGATKKWIDVVCCGHYHCPESISEQNMKIFVNGSICGTCDYALSHRMFDEPYQKLIIVDGKNFVDVNLAADAE